MSFFEKLNKKVKIGICIGIVVCLGSGVFVWWKMKNPNNSAKDQAENQIETYTIADNEKIFVNGTIVPKESKDFNISADNEIDKIKVENGKSVKKGDLLFTCKNNASISEIESLKAQVDDLKKQNITNSEGQADLSVTVEMTKLNTQISVLNKKAYTSVYAPFSGKVYLNEPSENVEQPTSFMTLQSNEFYMKGQANEQDLAKMQVDQTVKVLIFSTNQTLTGRISFISDRPSTQVNDMNIEQGSLSYYDVNIAFNDENKLVNGFHAQASLEISGGYAKVPSSAILKSEESPYVFKDLDGILKKQTVEIESKNDEYTVIKSGLSPNDIILRYPTEDMKEGDPIYPDSSINSEEGTVN